MIEHETKTNKDIILDGIVYHPQNNTVLLPRKYNTNFCKPVENIVVVEDIVNTKEKEVVKQGRKK